MGGPDYDLVKYRFGAEHIVVGWGFSEGLSIQCCTAADDSPEKQRTTGGRPLPGIEIRVVDPETGRDVDDGQVGEGYVRGATMREYWRDPQLTSRTIDKDGWLHTGDLICRDSDGYFTYRGRIRSLLRVGGEQVSSFEIESWIKSAHGVSDCCVVSAPDGRYGEVPIAFVATRDDSGPTERDLVEHCTVGLATFKVPRRVAIMRRLPTLGGSQKVDRRRLEELAAGLWAQGSKA
jgi:fatty-acyl-CoA synthase